MSPGQARHVRGSHEFAQCPTFRGLPREWLLAQKIWTLGSKCILCLSDFALHTALDSFPEFWDHMHGKEEKGCSGNLPWWEPADWLQWTFTGHLWSQSLEAGWVCLSPPPTENAGRTRVGHVPFPCPQNFYVNGWMGLWSFPQLKNKARSRDKACSKQSLGDGDTSIIAILFSWQPGHSLKALKKTDFPSCLHFLLLYRIRSVAHTEGEVILFYTNQLLKVNWDIWY